MRKEKMLEQNPRKQGVHLEDTERISAKCNQGLTGWYDRDFEGLVLRTWQ